MSELSSRLRISKEIFQSWYQCLRNSFSSATLRAERFVGGVRPWTSGFTYWSRERRAMRRRSQCGRIAWWWWRRASRFSMARRAAGESSGVVMLVLLRSCGVDGSSFVLFAGVVAADAVIVEE